MFKNYIKVAYRNFLRHKVYSAINISGLAIGLTCFLLIFLYIRDELSFDKMHSKTDRIYRLLENFESEGIGEHSASQPFPVGPTLMNDFGGMIDHTVRLFNFQSPTLTLANKELDKAFNESRFFFADSTFFDVFDFELIRGNKETALDNPNAILITESMVEKYFDGADPMGKNLEFQGGQNLEVVGVLADAPLNAHFQFDFIASFSSLNAHYNGQLPKTWYWNPCWTYLVLNENTTTEDLSAYFPDFVKKYFPDFVADDITLELQPLTDIHLKSRLDYEIQANGNESNIYIFSAVALFVLLIATINFVNLATARASKRAKEVGVRKSLGSVKTQLVFQFVVESVVLTLLACAVALILVSLALPEFNALTEKALSLSVLLEPVMILGIIGLSLLVGLLAGFYPAFVLSSFDPVLVLKNTFKKAGGFNFRKVLVTAQFTVSIVLIIGTIVAVRQLSLLQNDDIGFNKEEILMIPVIKSPMGKHYESFKSEALKSTNVLSMTAVEEVVGAKHQVNNYRFEGMEQSKPFPHFHVRHDFTSTFDIPMVVGRDYDMTMITDDSLALVVNEKLVQTMGWGTPQDALGKRFYFGDELRGKVIGVVKDYNFVSKHHPIAPFVLTLNSQPWAFNLFIKYVAVKVDGENITNAINDLDVAWSQFIPNRPFDYFFLDDRLNDSYKAEQKLSTVTLIFSGLAILVACLGLFGLATFSIEQRRKEIGVRKVLGISSSQLMVLLSSEFLFLILISFLIAVPISYVALREWLTDFAYRIDIGVWPYVIACFITFLVALVTISYHAFRAIRINPAETLKYE
ncbi:MAG: FtsX-like permease family protein [Cyclobacteriaceae bacterium]